VFVFGASGNVGKAITESLLFSAEKCSLRVVAGVHDKAKAGDELTKKGATLADVDMADRDSIKRALLAHSVDRIWLCPPNPKKGDGMYHRTKLCENVLTVARELGTIKFVLFGSVPFADRMEATFQKEFYPIERMLADTGIPYSIIRMNMFVENILAFQSFLKTGQFPQPLSPTAPFAPVAVSDIAQMAAAILCNPARHHSSVYTITGGEALTGPQMAEAISRATGRPVRFVESKPDLLFSTFSFMPEWQIRGVIELYEMVNRGAVLPTNDFAAVTGKPPTPYAHRIAQLWQAGVLRF